jgi:allophanate hydrolase
MLHSSLYTNECTKSVSALSGSLTTLADWQAAYRAGASPADLLRPLRGRLAARQGDVAILRLVTPAELDAQLAALARAAEASGDAARFAAERPLYGMPFAVKDNIDITGVATTVACPAFSFVAERSAHVVQVLQEAGAIWVAKTNLDQFATGLVGTRSPYGAPASCFDADRISGGSSSGSAVVVARGDVPFSLGTDTAGSGRVPAGFNQHVGLKPTPGRVGNSGIVPACRSLDCVSIFAHTVDDAASVLACVEGADPDDAYSRFAPGPATWPTSLRVGVPATPVFFGDAGYAAAWSAACAQLDALGHRRVELDFGALDEVAALLYDGPWVAERHTVCEGLLRDEPAAFDAVVGSVIGEARRFSATDAFRGQYRLRELASRCESIWQRCDVLMVPTAPGHPRFADVATDPIGVNAALGRYTNFVNLLGWCALALPAGPTSKGLPFGVTFIAPGGADAALAAFARLWQAALDLPLGATGLKATWSSARPDAWPKSEPTLPLAVVGAHLSGLPLNGQLVERGATLVETTRTAPRYRLHALAATVPAKPGLVRDARAGRGIDVEVWAMPLRRVGDFLSLIPSPLGLGSVELADGRFVHGFLCEADALASSPDISEFGGWRAYLASQAAA